MKNVPIRGLNMDDAIIEFIEETLDMTLYDYQKEMLKAFIEKPDGFKILSSPRRSSNIFYKLLKDQE